MIDWVNLIATATIGFVASFVGAAFGYWLTVRSDRRVAAKERARRAGIAAMTVSGFVSWVKVNLTGLPAAGESVLDPRDEFRVNSPDPSLISDSTRALLDLPIAAQEELATLIAKYGALLGACRMVRERAQELAGRFPEEKPWTGALASDPEYATRTAAVFALREEIGTLLANMAEILAGIAAGVEGQ